MTSRTSRYFLGLLAMLAAHAASAVGLGEIRLLSAMNEPLRAEISLLSIGDLNEAQIVAKLASPEDFKRSGVEREFQLTDLRFKVDLSNRANPVIRVTSQRPVKEPYLNFLIELSWTSGRLLREYTTLLDLPVYAGAQHAGKTAAAAPPAAAASTGPDESSIQPEVPRRAPVHRAPRTAPRPATATAGGSYRVQSGDTLWNIATHNQTPGVSIQQAMRAIVAANPDAFIQGDPNRIRRDAMLNLPDAAAMAAADSRAFPPSRQAVQNAPAERPIESRTRAADTPASGNGDGELRLAGGGGTDSGAGAAGRQSDGGAGTAHGDLGAVLEEKDRLERENAELKARVANLEEQAKAASRLVQISDPGLAALQTGTQKAPADAAAPAADTPVAEPPAAPANAPAETAAPATDTVPTAAAPAPVAPTPAAAPPPQAAPDLEDKFQDAITALRAWLVPALGVVGALLLLIMGFAAWRGRTQQQGLALPREFEGKGAGASQFSTEPVALADEDLLPDTHAFREGPDEILEEVDVCLSFGNEQQARELLTDALARFPEHAGLHLKMLELLVQEGDRPACEAMLPKLQALGDPRALETAAALMGELPGVDAEQPATSAPPATAEILLHPAAVRTATSPVEPARADDFDLDLDLDLDLPEPSAVVETTAKPRIEVPDALDDLDLDLFGGDAPEGMPEPVAAPTATAELAADAHQPSALDTDLDLFEPGQEMATQIELAEAYVDMGDAEGAREILDYVLEGGDDEQKESARRLLARLG